MVAGSRTVDEDVAYMGRRYRYFVLPFSALCVILVLAVAVPALLLTL